MAGYGTQQWAMRGTRPGLVKARQKARSGQAMLFPDFDPGHKGIAK
jgi:hypothetical protein